MKNLKHFIPSITLAISVLLFSGYAVADSDHEDFSKCTPLPEYTLQSSNGPEKFTKFVGKWTGYWQDNGKDALCHSLVVTKVLRKNLVEVIYSVGVYKPFKAKKASYSYAMGGINGEKGVLKITLSNGAIVKYLISDDGNELTGYYGKAKGAFTKTE